MSNRRLFAASLVLLCVNFGGAAPTHAREIAAAKPAASGSVNTTIYVVRTREFKLISFAFPLFIDGQNVGSLTAGTYIVVSRPAGHHAVDIKGDGIIASVHAELDATAGRTYFLQIGPYSGPPGQQLLESLFTGGAGFRGRPLGSADGPSRFYLLDTEQGRGTIDGLKDVTH